MTPPLSDATLTTWAINSRVNQHLLAALAPDALALPVGTGGWTVMGHLAHMAEAKTYWTGLLDAGAIQVLPTLPDSPQQGEISPAHLAEPTARIEQGVLAAVEQAADLGGLPYPTPDVFLLHLTHHDTHHRALILTALRQAGRAVLDDGELWGTWRTGGLT